MPFENIDLIGPKKSTPSKVPEQGVLVSTRRLKTRLGKEVSYIRIAIGAKLAKGISLVQPAVNVRLLFGTGSDAGFVQVSVDNTTGKFAAKRTRKGDYVLTINEATANGLFALAFEAFTVAPIEAIRPVNGQPPHFVFKASAQMLAVPE